ncbi:MAG: N-acetylmuramoyl-L-alanine amidase, partial [Terrimicrobiaceae bacterium]|nr:N-acetylmuramoyl-L-alanine amidase [Terrimicrobiaceae bacterium]
ARGFAVVMTRNSDVFFELEERARVAARHRSPLFVSLHFNSAANPAAQGFEVFSLAPRGAPSASAEDLMVSDMAENPGQPWELPGLALGQAVYHAMHGRVAMADRGMKRARFAVLRHARCPAVLIEGGFLSNPMDARRIASPGWRDRLADAIAEGIAAYAQLAAFGKRPPLAADYRLGARTRVRLSLPTPTPEPGAPSLRLRELPMPGH